MKRPHQSRLALFAVWALGLLLGTAQASPLLRTPAFTAARELAAPNSSSLMGSPLPATSLPSSSTLSLPWNTLLPNASACPTGVCMALPPAQSASAALLNFQVQNQCTLREPAATCKPASTSYWSTMQFSTKGLHTLERMEGWSNQNHPRKGEIPGVCYDDSGGHGTVGYGHEYPLGHTCAWYMNHPNSIYSPRYNYYEQHPLKKGSSAADQLLEHDVQSKAVVPIEQQVHVQLTQQQFDALAIWTFNVGGGHPRIHKGGLSGSDALADMNTCKMSAVPSDFTHYDHVNGPVSCGLYRRDMVSGEIWVSGSYTVPRHTFACPTNSVK